MHQRLLLPFLYALLSLTLLLFAAGWGATGLLPGQLAVWLPGLGWLTWLAFGEKWQTLRSLTWVEPLLVVLLTIGGAGSVAAAGIIGTAVPLLPAYLGVLGLLLVWDLSRFRRRMATTMVEDSWPALLAGHTRPLLLLVVLALLALVMITVAPFNFNFDWALGSAIVLLIGLAMLLRLLRNEN